MAKIFGEDSRFQWAEQGILYIIYPLDSIEILLLQNKRTSLRQFGDIMGFFN